MCLLLQVTKYFGGVTFDERPPALPLEFDPNNPDHLRLAENRIVHAFAGEAADAYRTGAAFSICDGPRQRAIYWLLWRRPESSTPIVVSATPSSTR